MDVRHLDSLPYTDVMPDGRPVTFADIRVGWWVQVYVGSWPHDTVSGYVTAVHSGGAVTATLKGRRPEFVPYRRLASTLRPESPLHRPEVCDGQMTPDATHA